MTTVESNCMESPNSKDSMLLNVEPNINVSSTKPKTSADLMYSEYVDTSGSERVGKLFEKKKEKPVMVSYGESPFYKKYSDLLTKLEESKDVLPPEDDEKLPVIEMEVYLKQNISTDSDSSDAEESKIIFCDTRDDCTTEEETTESENEDDEIVLTKLSDTMQAVSKENELCLKHEEIKSSNSSESNLPSEDCVSNVGSKSVLEKNCIDNSNYEPASKKLCRQ